MKKIKMQFHFAFHQSIRSSTLDCEAKIPLHFKTEQQKIKIIYSIIKYLDKQNKNKYQNIYQNKAHEQGLYQIIHCQLLIIHYFCPMITEIISTGDGSCTLRNEYFGETYHSINGAVAESMHIFINLGLKSFCNRNINILEIGYGTGLNALLTFIENQSLNNKIFYHGIEKFPINKEAFLSFVNHTPDISQKLDIDTAMKFCEGWNSEIEICPNFKLLKHQTDFKDFSPTRKYDIIYFDAFSPDTQPEMWTLENLGKIINNLVDDGIFVTYCCKGILKQNLRSLGMNVKRIQGPKGKRHVIRATKDINFSA